MKILVLTPHFPPLRGGISDFARQWVLAIAATPARPEVVVLTPAEAPGEPGYRVVRIANAWGARAWPALLASIEAERPDVIVLQYEPHMFQRRGLALAFTPFVARLAARGWPVVTIAHELYYARHEGVRRQPLGWVQRLALVPLFGGSRRVVFTVPDRLARMRTLFPRWAPRFRLLPIGRNIAPEGPGDFRAAHGVPPGVPLLLFMGLLHPSKGFGLVQRTLDALAERGLPARLVVMGGGRIEHPWALNLGFVEAHEAARALAACDLALLPLADGASTRRTSLVNALGAGLPVVSTLGANTDVGMLAEAVALVPVGDEAAFIEATASLLADPAARQALGARGRALFERALSWEVLAGRWYALLEEAIASPHQPPEVVE